MHTFGPSLDRDTEVEMIKRSEPLQLLFGLMAIGLNSFVTSDQVSGSDNNYAVVKSTCDDPDKHSEYHCKSGGAYFCETINCP